MKVITSVSGQLLYFDADLWEFIFEITGYRIVKKEGGYSYIKCTKGKYRDKMLSRILLSCPADSEVDHINGNPLDNRLTNLRIVTQQENKFNRVVSSKKKSELPKGVCFNKATGKYQAAIKHNGCTRTIGNFHTVTEAEDAYKKVAELYFGEFASHISRKMKAVE